LIKNIVPSSNCGNIIIILSDEFEGDYNHKRRKHSIKVNFEDQKFFLMEISYYVWRIFNGRENFKVEPVSTKIVFGTIKRFGDFRNIYYNRRIIKI